MVSYLESMHIVGKKFKHKKRQSVYKVSAIAYGQHSNDPDNIVENQDYVVYNSMDTNFVYIRPLYQFLDGRFEEVKE